MNVFNSKKIDKEYYKNWNLNLVKTTKFDKWFKSNQHLFVSKGKARIVSRKTNDESILIEIPQFYSISKIILMISFIWSSLPKYQVIQLESYSIW